MQSWLNNRIKCWFSDWMHVQIAMIYFNVLLLYRFFVSPWDELWLLWMSLAVPVLTLLYSNKWEWTSSFRNNTYSFLPCCRIARRTRSLLKFTTSNAAENEDCEMVQIYDWPLHLSLKLRSQFESVQGFMIFVTEASCILIWMWSLILMQHPYLSTWTQVMRKWPIDNSLSVLV